MNVKGTAIISTLKFLELNYSSDQLKSVMNKLSKSDRDILSEKLFPSVWYPFNTLINLTRLIDSDLGTGDLTLARKIGKFSADHDLKSIYKLFYKIGSPQFVISRASQVFATYYDIGRLETIDKGKGFMLLCLRNFPELDEIFLQRVSGWMEKTLELSGAVNPQVYTTIKEEHGKKIVEFKGAWK
ncbi:MAG TPA: hypothetical protein ENN73_01850 [Firmicutes bacterium]|nr:hypothetical protein [Bacillota bacterium]